MGDHAPEAMGEDGALTAPGRSVQAEVAIAMLEREGGWLLQLRDDSEAIVHPGTWGLFGGHLDPGETAEQGLRRELREEIGWEAGRLRWWLAHRSSERLLHVFLGSLTVPLQALELREGQDMTLASRGDLIAGRVWSERLGEFRALAPSLQMVVGQMEGR